MSKFGNVAIRLFVIGVAFHPIAAESQAQRYTYLRCQGMEVGKSDEGALTHYFKLEIGTKSLWVFDKVEGWTIKCNGDEDISSSVKEGNQPDETIQYRSICQFSSTDIIYGYDAWHLISKRPFLKEHIDLNRFRGSYSYSKYSELDETIHKAINEALPNDEISNEKYRGEFYTGQCKVIAQNQLPAIPIRKF